MHAQFLDVNQFPGFFPLFTKGVGLVPLFAVVVVIQKRMLRDQEYFLNFMLKSQGFAKGLILGHLQPVVFKVFCTYPK